MTHLHAATAVPKAACIALQRRRSGVLQQAGSDSRIRMCTQAIICGGPAVRELTI